MTREEKKIFKSAAQIVAKEDNDNYWSCWALLQAGLNDRRLQYRYLNLFDLDYGVGFRFEENPRDLRILALLFAAEIL